MRFRTTVLVALAFCLGGSSFGADGPVPPRGMGLLRPVVPLRERAVLPAGMSVVDPARVLASAEPPPSAYFVSGVPPIGDQGAQGSCTAWAMNYYHKTQEEWTVRGWDVSVPQHQYSPAFMYNHINGGDDNGSYSSDAVEQMYEMGAATLAEMPYYDWDCDDWPAESVYVNALSVRAAASHVLDVTNGSGLSALKAHIATGRTAVIGISVYANFFYIELYNNTYTVAESQGLVYGGHALCVVGYDDGFSTVDGYGAVRIANSWGTGWGDSGYFWMSYAAVMSTEVGHGEAHWTDARVGYAPEIIGRFRIDHARRGNVIQRGGLRFGFGAGSWEEGFLSFPDMEWYCLDYGAGWYHHRAFPPNEIAVDLSDGVAYAQPYGRAYVSAEDSESTTVGTIESASVEWSIETFSDDPPVAIPDDGTPVFAEMALDTRLITVGHAPEYDYQTVSAALGDSGPGDTLRIAPGTYDSVSGEVFPLVVGPEVRLEAEDYYDRPVIAAGAGASVIDTGAGAEPVELAGLVISGGMTGVVVGGLLHSERCVLDGCEVGMYVTSTGEATLWGAEVRGITPGRGVLVGSGGSAVLESCILHGNAGGYAVYVISGGSAQLRNCTVADNAGIGAGGGAGLSLNSCIFAGNAGGSVDPGSAVSYSAVEGGYAGLGNIDADPQFAAGDFSPYELAVASPCVDAGDPAAEREDQSRPPAGGLARCDMGAFGGPHNLTAIIGEIAVTVGHGPQYQYQTIGEALAAADPQGGSDPVVTRSIAVAPGTYAAASGEVFPLVIDPGLTLRALDADDRPTLEGSGDNPVLHMEDIPADSSTLVDGLIITGGTGHWVSANSFGGGAYINNAAPVLRNCLFTGNQAMYGGGAYVANGDAVFENCVFSGNEALHDDYPKGGGFMCFGFCSPVLRNCLVLDNFSEEEGGGVKIYNGPTLTMENCVVAGNSVVHGPGLLAKGGGINVSAGGLVANNCVIAENSSNYMGGGLYIAHGADVGLLNCIVWNNAAPSGNSFYFDDGVLTMDYACINSGFPGTGNISDDPQFEAGPVSDYELAEPSPCVDAGDPAPAWDDAAVPPAKGGSRCDMGAFGGPGADGWDWGPPVIVSDSPAWGAGWQLVSVPLVAESMDVSEVLDDVAAAGNELTNAVFAFDGAYSVYPGGFTCAAAGEGYWLWLDVAASEQMEGTEALAPCGMPLGGGWNLVGHPCADAVPWSACQVSDGVETKGVPDAEAAGWIDPAVYYFAGGEYKQLRSDGAGDDDTLRPWYGYWLLANQTGLTLIVP